MELTLPLTVILTIVCGLFAALFGYMGARPMNLHKGPRMVPWTFLMLLAFTGPATAIPLLLFAFAIRRLRMTTIGMFQYLAPSIQFLVAIWLFGEHLNPLRLFSFALIWLSLAVFSYDSFRRRGQVAVPA